MGAWHNSDGVTAALPHRARLRGTGFRQHRLRILTTGWLALLLAAAPPASRLAPVDACAGDKALAAARAELSAAVKRRDGKRLSALVSDDVLVDFGGASGRGALAGAWHLDARAESPIWPALEALLPLGCAFSGDAAIIPAYFARFPPELDAAQWVIALGADVALRAGPRAGARITARLDWELLKLADPPDPDASWIAVERPPGVRGYIARRESRPILGERLVYRREHGQWRIVAFVAGD